MTSRDTLVVWLHSTPIAELRAGTNGELKLAYTSAAFDNYDINQPVLSCALPLRQRGLSATAFVDGLLPEGDARRRLAERARVAAHDMFGLVRRYGRDVAGAVQFLEPGQEPSSENHRVEPLDAGQLDGMVDELDTNPLAIVDESELSLPGVQPKMLLVDLGAGRWGRPLGGRPSTHILKRDHHVHRGLVAAECEALALARHVGLSNFDAHIERFADYDCLIVERYDRVVADDGSVTRVHQEDACQALGLGSTTKYEIHHGGGGPEFSQIAELLDRHSQDPTGQLDRLAQMAVFTALIGNADAHGKNVAFLIDAGHISLAPMFDTVPTVLWPKLRSEAAMTIGGAVSMSAVDASAIGREARSWNHSATAAIAAAEQCARGLIDAIDTGVIDAAGDLAAHVRSTTNRFLHTL